MIKLSFTKLMLFLIVMALFHSCAKEDLTFEPNRNDVIQENESVIFNISDQSVGLRSKGAETLNRTILGSNRQNPFTVEKMAEAHNLLYETSMENMETTDLYVKFEPTSLQEIQLLLDTDENFYDFDLEYEVIEMGDYYQEAVEGSFPTLYAIVPIDFSFPNLTYEIKDNLHLDKSNPILIAESFRLTGNSKDIKPYVFNNAGLTGKEVGTEGLKKIPTAPECPFGYHPEWFTNPNPQGPFDGYWECVPNPPQVEELNECGCPISIFKKKPAGCVQVEDTELSEPWNTSTYEGVRRVKVIMKDTWFTEDETWTDDNGCWSINEYYSGKAWMWVKFKNDRCKIRTAGKGVKSAWRWMKAVKDYVGKIKNKPFNDIEVNYHMWSDIQSNGHRYWGAATVNNAVHEFHDYAIEEGINVPPHMDIYAGANRRFGYALMSAQSNLIQIIGNSFELASSSIISPFDVLLGNIGLVLLVKFIVPDVFIGTNFTNSDDLKRLAFHEIAHASHFTQVGVSYWEDLVFTEIHASFVDGDSHGNENSLNAGLISVCESWAEHVGFEFTHKKYQTLGTEWEMRLEETWNEVTNHIPIGLYYDLIDNGEPIFNEGAGPVSACNQDDDPLQCTIISDNVSGFTNAQMFSSLTSSVITIEDFRTEIIDNHLTSTSNTVQQVNDLFNSY